MENDAKIINGVRSIKSVDLGSEGGGCKQTVFEQGGIKYLPKPAINSTL